MILYRALREFRGSAGGSGEGKQVADEKAERRTIIGEMAGNILLRIHRTTEGGITHFLSRTLAMEARRLTISQSTIQMSFTECRARLHSDIYS